MLCIPSIMEEDVDLVKIFPMSRLLVYDEEGRLLEKLEDPEQIAERLSEIGVLFERWEPGVPLSESAGEDEVLEAFKDP